MAKQDKSAGQKLADKLFFNPKNCWETLEETEEKKAYDFADNYRQFLNNGKTERECIEGIVKMLEKQGFKDIETLKGKIQAPGTGIYQNIKGKALIAAVMGKKPVTAGCNILGAHVDAPRLDLKQKPLYEDSGLALFDTHYYGGIKKYQWTAIPLAMHGVIIKDDGKKIEFKIGEAADDPVFTITDLLPHLAQDQMQKKGTEVVEGENLDILAGSRPYNDKDVKEKIKLNLLSLLNKKYGITEKDFAGAEIEFVPAFAARDLGLDRSMIGAYGHDDRCCAWPAIKALASLASGTAASGTSASKTPQPQKAPEKTAVCYLSDKEEIGSMGNTGAQSLMFFNFLSMLCKDNEADLRLCLSNSSMLSADVSAAFDPTYPEVFDKKSGSFMGKGLVLTKYTGSRGKYGASDANAEFCARIQSIMDKNKIDWQLGEMGKVDKGGGGTIALHAANLGIEVIDCGIPVLSMHSPFEVISKIDLYTAYKGYIAFLKDA